MKKSSNDNKTYHSFSLKNGLTIVLVEDTNNYKSACSLVVNTGSFDDPIDRPGFAHFVEHLLFNGNKKYPQPSLLSDFVSQHGGHCNAWTSIEHSNYHFDIQPEYFHQALEYFTHMFVNPLFDEQGIEKERNAIHEEYKLKLKDDSRRIQQVHKETANPHHPYSKFSVGNKGTLSDYPDRPIKNELKEFWQQEYQARYMTLAIVSPEKIETFKPLIEQLFSQIQNDHRVAYNRQLNVSKQIHHSLYLQNQLATFIAIQPVKELHKLNITFALPSINGWYKDKMVSFIAHIIGYEGKGSLFENFKRLGLINELSAGNGISGSNFKDFNLSLELTEKGENELEFIIKEVFAFLNLLAKQTPEGYLYDEQQQLSLISFKYQEELKPLKLANSLALNLQHYPEEDLVFGDYRMDGFSHQRWQQIFSYFKADNLRITLVSKNVHVDKKTHWYQTPYSVENLSKQQIEELNNHIQTEYTYQFPKSNPYLKGSYAIEKSHSFHPTPIQINQELGWNSWFKQNTNNKVPKGSIYLGFDLPEGICTNENQALMRLFCDMFMDAVSEQHYQAEMAGLHYNLYAHHAGMTLHTSGFSTNQERLLMTLVDNILSIEFSPIRFNEIKQQLIKHWKNAESNKPINQLFSLLNQKLMPQVAPSIGLAYALNNMEFESFNLFRAKLFSKIHVNFLIHGNWTTKQAEKINQQLKKRFINIEKVPEIVSQTQNFSNKDLQCFTKELAEGDAASLIYIQEKKTCQIKNDASKSEHLNKAYFILISQILSSFSFNYLRTEKQLGYLAGSGYMPLCNKPGLAIYIQSHQYDSKNLLQHLKECLNSFTDELKKMPEQEFQHHKKAVIHQYREIPSNMNQKTKQWWVSIGNKDETFSQKDDIATIINSLNINDMIDWCFEHINDNNLKGLALITQ